MTTNTTSGPMPIAYEVDGPSDGQPLLMLNGLGMQLTQWPEPFLQSLHDAGLKTIRIDNRDVGLSGRAEGKKAPNPYLQLLLTTFGLSTSAPYRLEDMADDAVSVLDELGINKAHVLGLSMGGIIGQVFAARHKERVDRTVFLMTSTNNRALPRPKGEAARILFNREGPPRTLDEAVDQIVAKWQFFMTRDGGMSEADLRAFHEAAIKRGADHHGWQRQLAAIIETGDLRRRFTSQIEAPTLIIHGTEDRLVPIEGGRDIKKNIPHAALEEIEGMGHDLAPKLHDRLSGLVVDHLCSR